jgi:hypothetical protein
MVAEEAFMMLFLFSAFASAGWLRASWMRRKLQQRVDMAVANGLPATAILGAGSAKDAPMGYDRVEDLENQMDQVVGQLDRLAESQEFLSRVLTDRLQVPMDRRDETPGDRGEMRTPD